MSNFRNIAPRLHVEPALESTETAEPARTSKVAIACGACRTKRTKCDGAKPTCQACTARDTACEYLPPPGQVHAQAQKRKIEELEHDKSSMYEILWYLQTTSPDKATALLQHLRATQGDDMGAVLKHFDQDRHDPSSSNPTSLPISDNIVSPALTVPEVIDHPQLQDVGSNSNGQIGIALPTSSWGKYAAVNGLDRSLEMFFNCVGVLFYIMNKDDVQKSIQAIRAADHAHTPLGDISSSGGSLQLIAIASELAGMAALGVVHAQLADPVSAPPSELADYFYAVAKHGLDFAIQYNPLRAIKVAALVAMYNVVVHAQVALAYTELGLSLARNHGLESSRRPPGLSEAEVTDIRRTHRTLIHLQCWMSASLDYVSDSLSSSLHLAIDEPDTPPEDRIRRECIKITVIKASTLHRLPEGAPVLEATVAEFRTRLSQHHSQLPEWMSLGQLLSHSESELMMQFRPVIFYVHLFYLSAMMLLSRRLIIAYVALDATDKIALLPEARQAIEEGYLAAQTQARMMELMLAEGKVVQVCWLCIFTTYTAGVMTAYVAAQNALQGVSFDSELELLNKCILVLAYCSRKDALAGKFHDVLNAHLETLQQHNASTGNPTDTTASHQSPTVDILFTRHVGTSNLHSASRTLLRLTHRPFSGLPNVLAQATLSNRAETTMGTHLEWEWELKGRECADKMAKTPEVCGISTDTDDQRSAKRVMLQPGGGPWSVWTPRTWDSAFSA